MTSAYETEDLSAPEVTADPYGYYGSLREADRVHWNPLHSEWVVTGYDEVVWLVRHHEIFSSEFSPQGYPPSEIVPPIRVEDWPLAEHMHATFQPLIFHDRPKHLAMRQALHKCFTPRTVEKWRQQLRSTVREVIEGCLPDGSMEVKEDFAVWMPLTTIVSLLGIPQSDGARLHALTDKLVNLGFSPERMRSAVDAWRELGEYFAPLLKERAKNPGDDLLSTLAEAQRNGSYGEDECLATAVFLMMAGHSTTMNLISNGMLTLVRNPDQWRLLREDPGGLCASATEECLRFEPPVTGSVRICKGDIELGGKEIGAGDRVFWVIAAANRDPAVFPDPERFDIRRSPNPHVSFGGGIHHCLGAALARVEAQEAFRALAEVLPPNLRVDGAVEYVPAKLDRELRSLHVRWD